MKRHAHAVLANKAYFGQTLRNLIKNRDIKAAPPQKSNEKMASDRGSLFDNNAYNNRNVVGLLNGILTTENNTVASLHITTRRQETTCRW